MEDDREMRDGEAMIPETGNGDRCAYSRFIVTKDLG